MRAWVDRIAAWIGRPRHHAHTDCPLRNAHTIADMERALSAPLDPREDDR